MPTRLKKQMKREKGGELNLFFFWLAILEQANSSFGRDLVSDNGREVTSKRQNTNIFEGSFSLTAESYPSYSLAMFPI